MRRSCRLSPWLVACALAATHARPAGAVDAYVSRIGTANALAATVTNYGLIGNNFVNRTASLEFPAGSGYEHLRLAGLWIGASATDASGAFVGVTTGELDGTQGSAAASHTEFSPNGSAFLLRSTSAFSPYYTPDAVSLLDQISFFDDLTPKRASGSSEDHRPLHVRVRQTTHQWTFHELDGALFVRFVVTNLGSALTNVWLGLYGEFVAVDKNAYASWPPTSGGSAYGSAYGRKWLAWDSGTRTVRAHYCAASPVPGACLLQRVPPWMGLTLLTPPASGQAVTVGLHNWNAFDPALDSDLERYAFLAAGAVTNPESPPYLPGVGDPLVLLALGPRPSLAPGDSMEVAFALVGAATADSLALAAQAAQRVRDHGYADPTAGVVSGPGAGRPAALSVVVNPTGGAPPRLAFSIFERASGRLALYDPAGRRVWHRSLLGLEPGSYVFEVDGADALAPGLYFAVLAHGSERATARVVITR